MLYTTLQNLLNKVAYVFPNILTRVYEVKQQEYAERVEFSHSCVDNMPSSFGFSRQIGLSDEWVIQISEFASNQNRWTVGTGMLQRFNRMIDTARN